MRNKHFIPKLSVSGVLVLTVMVTVAWSVAFATVPAHAEEKALTPIWTADAPVLNHSTAALVMGRHARAIHFAAKALPHSTAERAVAAHNLCLAHLSLGAAAEAEMHCRAALGADDATVVWKYGSATIGNPAAFAQDQAQVNGTASLRTLMHANIAQAYGQATVNKIVVANAAHPTP